MMCYARCAMGALGGSLAFACASWQELDIGFGEGSATSVDLEQHLKKAHAVSSTATISLKFIHISAKSPSSFQSLLPSRSISNLI